VKERPGGVAQLHDVRRARHLFLIVPKSPGLKFVAGLVWGAAGTAGVDGRATCRC